MTDVRIELEPQGDTVKISLARYLGDRFGAYREACARAGARYVPAGKHNRAPVDAAAQVLLELRRADLEVEVDDAVAGRLRERAAEAKDLLDQGRDRLAAIDAALAGTGRSPFPFQRTGVEWLAPRAKALLADEMGLGKTVQALVALPAGAAAIAIVPAVVRRNWSTECRRWRSDLEPVEIASRAQFRWPMAGELVIATYGCLPRVKDGVVELPGVPEVGTTIVCDEAHALKSSKAQRTVAFRELAKAALAHSGRVWLVTGTPLLNKPPELWNVLQAADLATDAFGSWSEFCRVFNGRKGRFGYDWGRATDEVPDRLRRVMLSRRREEVMPELPTKTRQDLTVDGLSRETIAACDEAMAALGLEDASDVPTIRPGVPGFDQLSRARALLATAKIKAMLEVVAEHEEAGEPLVVGCCHRAPIDVLGQREGWATITGDTPADERGRIVDAFQAGELKGIAGTTKAMGVGVTLTRAHRLLQVDLDWTPAMNSQLEDRVCRIGQTRGVVILRLVATHALDERVVELLTAKQEILEASVEAAAVESSYVGSSPAEELARAAELAAEAASRPAPAPAQVAAPASTSRNGNGSQGRRGPTTPAEEHAARALVQLAALDPDRAAEPNGAGFNRLDGNFGHSLAEQVARSGQLSEKQWNCAVRLVRKYRRQVGEV